MTDFFDRELGRRMADPDFANEFELAQSRLRAAEVLRALPRDRPDAEARRVADESP